MRAHQAFNSAAVQLLKKMHFCTPCRAGGTNGPEGQLLPQPHLLPDLGKFRSKTCTIKWPSITANPPNFKTFRRLCPVIPSTESQIMQGCRSRGWGGQDFGRSVNPISTREGRLCPHITTCLPRIFRPSYGPLMCVLYPSPA